MGNRPTESGQAIFLVVLALGVFLMGATALAVDITNLWFHRQAAQTAADAACMSGAQSMLTAVNTGGSYTSTFTTSWNTGTAFDCNSTTNTPCSYASLNGYSSSLTTTDVSSAGNTAGNNVRGSFPTGTCPGGSDCPAPGVTPAAIARPFFRVDVVDRAPVFFLGLLNAARTQDVHAVAVCGVVAQQSTVPIAVLSPTKDSSLTVAGTAALAIAG